MRIKKKNVYLVAGAFVVAVLGSLGAWGWMHVNSVWNDQKTWTTEQAVLLPSAASALGLAVDGNPLDGQFTFSAPYCFLYEITKNESVATLKCSLLPFYYSKRALEVPKDWKEKSDIVLVVKSSDPHPSAFLGRQDTSFESVSTLGSDALPVAVNLKGTSQRKEKNLINLINHALVTTDRSKENIPVSLESWSMQRLDTPTQAQEKAYADEWVKKVNEKLQREFETSVESVKDPQEKLNVYRDYFSTDSVRCSDLDSCEGTYQSNAAQKVVFYMYALSKSNKQEFDKYFADFKKYLYPFYPTRPAAQVFSNDPTQKVDWTVFSAYNFPICPVVEINKNVSNSNTELFHLYAKGLARVLEDDYKLPTNEAEHIEWLKRYSRNLYFPGEGWDGDLIHQLNMSCDYVVTKGAANVPTLAKRVTEIFMDMFSLSLDQNVKLEKQEIAKVIYNGSRFSPYVNPYVIDSITMKERESFLDMTDKAGNSYVEWKSQSNSLILLYLYESL